MKTELLLRLADYLEKDAANPHGFKFDMWTWAQPSINGDAMWRTVTDTPMAPEPNCGTSACAMGVAAISGIFQPEGLTYYIDADDGEFQFRFGGKWSGGFGAAQSLFEITDYQSHYLFDGDYYRSLGLEMTGHEGELAVAKRIRAFVDSDGKMPELANRLYPDE